MTPTTETVERADALAERLFGATLGALELFSVYLGVELGLYRTLERHGALTPNELAERAGIAPRYAREWLEQQAVAGLLEVVDALLDSLNMNDRRPLAERISRWAGGVLFKTREGRLVIPTLILFGLVFGRWWRLSLVAAAVGWPVLLVADGVMDVEVGLLGAAGLAVVNASVGVLVHQGVLRALRLLRHRNAPGRIG